MYAVISTGGKQYRVSKGDTIRIEKLDKKEGDKVLFDKVLLISDKGKVMTISIIRDPFSRSISDYFHSNKNFISKCYIFCNFF